MTGESRFSRTEALLGSAGFGRLQAASVCVIGLGGVGSYTAEALARGGIGALTLVDGDTVAESNCNRQLCALESTIGMPKAEVVAARVRQINPACKVTALPLRYTGTELDLTQFSYIADAIDSVPDKLQLLIQAARLGVPILSCMGAGNKLDPMGFRVCDMEKTFGDPLAKRMRLSLRKAGVRHLQVIFSPEAPVKPHIAGMPIGSVSWVPGAAGLLQAGTILQAIATDTCPKPVYIPVDDSEKLTAPAVME